MCSTTAPSLESETSRKLGGREVVVQWDQGGGWRKQGAITDAEWEVFKLAIAGTGRVAVLSDLVAGWQFDYRFLEAQR